jgi:hypothetical protein
MDDKMDARRQALETVLQVRPNDEAYRPSTPTRKDNIVAAFLHAVNRLSMVESDLRGQDRVPN